MFPLISFRDFSVLFAKKFSISEVGLEKQIIVLFKAIFENVINHQADDSGDTNFDQDNNQQGN